MTDSSARRPISVVARRELRRRLVAARAVRFSIRDEAAAKLGFTKRILGAIETGESLPNDGQLATLFDGLGIAEAEQALWKDLVAAAREPGWWDQFEDADLSRDAKRFLAYEAAATKVRVFSGAFIAALLQTSNYRMALLRDQAGAPAPERIERQLEIHARRKALLEPSGPLGYHMILDESALYRDAGPGVMAGQLDHLIELVESTPQVTVQIVPYQAGLYRALSDTMTLLAFGQPGDGLGYIESAAAGDRYVEDSDLYPYSATFEELAHDRAESPGLTLDTLRKARELATRSHR